MLFLINMKVGWYNCDRATRGLYLKSVLESMFIKTEKFSDN